MSETTRRDLWVLGNWKQNHRRAELTGFVQSFAPGLSEHRSTPRYARVGIAPSLVLLSEAAASLRDSGAEVRCLAQDCAAQESGAHTGEVGPSMLLDVGIHSTILGHSERRASYGDGDELVRAKLRCALRAGLEVVLCVGEGLEVRDAGNHEKHVISQLKHAFEHLEDEVGEPALTRLVIAYEPIWAIGTGRTASPEQAAEMHGALRAFLEQRFGQAGRDRSILYGGSVKPSNATDLLASPEVDGFLVGGASLDAGSFLDIVRAADEARP